jgi:hypothetical protein
MGPAWVGDEALAPEVGRRGATHVQATRGKRLESRALWLAASVHSAPSVHSNEEGGNRGRRRADRDPG